MSVPDVPEMAVAQRKSLVVSKTSGWSSQKQADSMDHQPADVLAEAAESGVVVLSAHQSILAVDQC